MRARLIAAAPALMLTAVVADAAVLTPDRSCRYRHRGKSADARAGARARIPEQPAASGCELHEFPRYRPPIAAKLPCLILGRSAGHRVGCEAQPGWVQSDRQRPHPGRHQRPTAQHPPRRAQSRGRANPGRPQLCRLFGRPPRSRLYRGFAHRASRQRHRLSAQAQSVGELAGGKGRCGRPQ